jgi:hypothetical protein
MPGTGMSLVRFLTLLLWLKAASYLLTLVAGMLMQHSPNVYTAAIYSVISA